MSPIDLTRRSSTPGQDSRGAPQDVARPVRHEREVSERIPPVLALRFERFRRVITWNHRHPAIGGRVIPQGR